MICAGPMCKFIQKKAYCENHKISTGKIFCARVFAEKWNKMFSHESWNTWVDRDD